MSPPERIDFEDSLEFTGERFIPHQTDPLLALEHYHRYCFASRFAANKRILDSGCGEGYGSFFLSKTAAEVLGIDIDPATVEHARTKYSSVSNLAFEVGRCEESPRNAAPFDMVVAFELLEHLGPEDQVQFLQNVRRVLKQEGTLIISSPERYEYGTTYQARNEFHKHEMTLPELKSFLESFFKHVHIFAQRVLSLSTTWQLEDWRGAQFRFHARKDLFVEIPCSESLAEPLYLIGICSDLPIPGAVLAESNSFYLDTSNSDQTKVFSRWAQQLNLEAQKSRELIQSTQRQIEERTAWALDQDSRVKAQIEHIEILKKELDDRTRWALSLESAAAKERAHAEEIDREMIRTRDEMIAIEKKMSSSRLYRVLAKIRLLPNVWSK